MPEEAIVVHARPTRAQLVRTRFRLYLRSGTGLQLTLGGFLGPPAMWAIWQAMGTQPWPSSNDFIFVVAPGFAIGMLALVTFGGLNHPRTRAYLREGADYALTDDAFAVRGAMGEAHLKWDACTRAIEFPDLFLVRLGNELHLLPKADFAAGDLDRLRALLRDRLGKRASLKTGPARR